MLYGGRGADALRGGDGGDGLYDASPREPLRSGDLDPYLEETVVALADPGRGRDSFDGGRGRDGVSYDGRSAGVRVDLVDTAAVGGARGEHDSVKSVQNAVGGGGDDRLAGNKRSNTLDGAGGDDRIVAGHGNDYIEGGTGRNVIIAGPGDDLINSLYRPSDNGAERTFCGPGLDHVSWTFPSDFVNDDCEALEFNFLREGGLFGGDVRSQLPLRKRWRSSRAGRARTLVLLRREPLRLWAQARPISRWPRLSARDRPAAGDAARLPVVHVLAEREEEREPERLAGRAQDAAAPPRSERTRARH